MALVKFSGFSISSDDLMCHVNHTIPREWYEYSASIPDIAQAHKLIRWIKQHMALSGDVRQVSYRDQTTTIVSVFFEVENDKWLFALLDRKEWIDAISKD